MAERARLVGINHVALEVGDVEQALALYGRLFEFDMRGRVTHMAFVDMGDQFIAISEPRRQSADDSRHFGLVVDDVAAARAAVTREGLAIVGQSRRSFDFLDPWGTGSRLSATATSSSNAWTASSAGSASRRSRRRTTPGDRYPSVGSTERPQPLQIKITLEVVMADTTCHMSISLDGFVAGPDQSLEDPLGKRGLELHGWHLGDERAN